MLGSIHNLQTIILSQIMLHHRKFYLGALKAQPCHSLPFRPCRTNLDPLRLTSATTCLPYSTTGYGDGEGDPRGQDPNAQGVNQRSRELEHPGPPQHGKTSNSHSSNKSNSSKPESQNQRQEKKESAYGSLKESPNKPRTRVK